MFLAVGRRANFEFQASPQMFKVGPAALGLMLVSPVSSPNGGKGLVRSQSQYLQSFSSLRRISCDWWHSH